METLKRYNRQVILPEIGLAGQQKLTDASVLVIGAGGLGCPLLLYLAAAGVGRIGMVDDDVVDESNLHRQVLYHAADIGKQKAITAAKKLQLFNPQINLLPYPFRLTAENAARLIAPYDIIIDGSDNFATRYLVNDTCVVLNKPLIFGSIYRFEGQVAVFNHEGGPDYRTLYPEPPQSNEVTDCGTTGIIGTLPGIIGSYMANEAIKIICGFGETLSGKLLTFDALTNQSSIFKLTATRPPELTNHLPKTDVVLPNEPATLFKKHIQHTDTPKNGIEEIELDVVKKWEKEHEPFCLIDVREAYEFEEQNIGGLNIPLYELQAQITHLPKVKKFVFCCTTGYRSNIAAKLFNPNEHEIYTIKLYK
jgi:molybdopterin/thiamine biosynthesis adenylyltransferase